MVNFVRVLVKHQEVIQMFSRLRKRNVMIGVWPGKPLECLHIHVPHEDYTLALGRRSVQLKLLRIAHLGIIDSDTRNVRHIRLEMRVDDSKRLGVSELALNSEMALFNKAIYTCRHEIRLKHGNLVDPNLRFCENREATSTLQAPQTGANPTAVIREKRRPLVRGGGCLEDVTLAHGERLLETYNVCSRFRENPIRNRIHIRSYPWQTVDVVCEYLQKHLPYAV